MGLSNCTKEALRTYTVPQRMQLRGVQIVYTSKISQFVNKQGSRKLAPLFSDKPHVVGQNAISMKKLRNVIQIRQIH